MPNTLWIERLDTHAEPFWRVRLGTRGICFRNELDEAWLVGF